MRRLLVILLISLSSVLQVSAGLNPQEQSLRDSIFGVFHSLPRDTVGVKYLIEEFQRNISGDWSVELLDSALQAAIPLGYGSLEVIIHHEKFRYSQIRSDIPGMEQTLLALKESSYRYKILGNYFSAWAKLLDMQCSRGNIEYAIQQAKQMKSEAEEASSTEGLYTSCIALGLAYGYSEQFAEGAAAYEEALTYPIERVNDRLDLYFGLSGCYIGLKNVEKAVPILNKEKEQLEQLVKAYPTSYPLFRNRLLSNELRFCGLYVEVDDLPNLKTHLLLAKKHYTEDTFLPYYLEYHLSWAAYYHGIKDWDTCFAELNLVLEHCNGGMPWYEQNVRKTRAEYLWDAGRKEAALAAYKEQVQAGDSLIQYFRNKQEETVQSNYRIRSELKKQVDNENKVRWLAFASGIILFIIIIVFTIRTLYIRSLLKKAEAETRAASELARKANHMKDIFLKNIVHEIQLPLDSVVKFSRLLSVERNTLSPEHRAMYSSSITENADKLITLVNNVLDLSRLESGMMRFDVQSYDVVQLCRDAIYMAGMQQGNLATVTFEHDVESLSFHIDSSRFMKLLTSLFVAKDEAVTIHCKLLGASPEQAITLIVTGSPLSAVSVDRLQQIQHDINRLFVDIFHGSYTIESEEGRITVCFPTEK